MAKNEIAKQSGVPAFLQTHKPKFDTEVADSQSGDGYLRYIKLLSKSSPKVDAEDANPNHWYLCEGKELVEDLGKQVDVLLITWRPMALDTVSRVSSHDPESDLYKKIKAASLKGGDEGQGKLFGNQYLIWLSKQQEFVNFFACSKSARRESHVLTQNLGKSMTLTSTKATNAKGNTWSIPTAIACNSKINYPTEQAFNDEVKKFENPVEQTRQLTDGGGARD